MRKSLSCWLGWAGLELLVLTLGAEKMRLWPGSDLGWELPIPAQAPSLLLDALGREVEGHPNSPDWWVPLRGGALGSGRDPPKQKGAWPWGQMRGKGLQLLGRR